MALLQEIPWEDAPDDWRDNHIEVDLELRYELAVLRRVPMRHPGNVRVNRSGRHNAIRLFALLHQEYAVAALREAVGPQSPIVPIVVTRRCERNGVRKIVPLPLRPGKKECAHGN